MPEAKDTHVYVVINKHGERVFVRKHAAIARCPVGGAVLELPVSAGTVVFTREEKCSES
jgi:hypothetical protein